MVKNNGDFAMFVITNRRLTANSGDLSIFGSTPNENGANELRLVDIRKNRKGYTAVVLDDVLEVNHIRELKQTFGLDINENDTWYSSLYVACNLFKRAKRERKSLLLYVHGYNNDMDDVIASAQKIEQQYGNVIVIPFSWPAKGGGAVSGTANYIDDKRDARSSGVALDRTVQIVQQMHSLLTKGQSADLWVQANNKYPDNLEAARALFVKLQAKSCRVSLNLLCHSMGNYVLKYATIPSGSYMRKLTFENICLVAADTNNHDHAGWVGALDSRVGTYVVINENDYALQWARRKPGEAQKARLGHYLRNLIAPNVAYLDVSDAAFVNDQHSYFYGNAIEKNQRLKSLFAALFCGQRPEAQSTILRYQPEFNAWRIK